ncbi:hypothetical protein ACOMHN_060547 [Nucella lapillus]
MNAIDFYIFWSFFGAVIPPRFQAMWTLFLLHLVSFLWYQPAPCLQQLYPSFFSPALSHPLHYSSPPPPAPVPSVYPLRHYPPPLPSPPSSNLPMRYSRDQLLEIQPSTPNFELVNRLRELRLGVGLPRKQGCRGGRKKLRSIQVVPSRNLHPLMVPPFLQPHPDLQSAVGNAPLSSKHPTHLPTTDCLLSITPLMGGQPSDAPALSPPSPLQQGGQSSNAPALSPPSPLPQGSQPIALALSPSSPLPQDGQPSDAPGLSPSSSTLLLCPSDSTLSICHLNSQSAVKTACLMLQTSPPLTPREKNRTSLLLRFKVPTPYQFSRSLLNRLFPAKKLKSQTINRKLLPISPLTPCPKSAPNAQCNSVGRQLRSVNPPTSTSSQQDDFKHAVSASVKHEPQDTHAESPNAQLMPHTASTSSVKAVQLIGQRQIDEIKRSVKSSAKGHRSQKSGSRSARSSSSTSSKKLIKRSEAAALKLRQQAMPYLEQHEKAELDMQRKIEEEEMLLRAELDHLEAQQKADKAQAEAQRKVEEAQQKADKARAEAQRKVEEAQEEAQGKAEEFKLRIEKTRKLNEMKDRLARIKTEKEHAKLQVDIKAAEVAAAILEAGSEVDDASMVLSSLAPLNRTRDLFLNRTDEVSSQPSNAVGTAQATSQPSASRIHKDHLKLTSHPLRYSNPAPNLHFQANMSIGNRQSCVKQDCELTTQSLNLQSNLHRLMKPVHHSHQDGSREVPLSTGPCQQLLFPKYSTSRVVDSIFDNTGEREEKAPLEPAVAFPGTKKSATPYGVGKTTHAVSESVNPTLAGDPQQYNGTTHYHGSPPYGYRDSAQCDQHLSAQAPPFVPTNSNISYSDQKATEEQSIVKSFETFVDFLDFESNALQHVPFLRPRKPGNPDTPIDKADRSNMTFFTNSGPGDDQSQIASLEDETNAGEPPSQTGKRKPTCLFCKNAHYVPECKKFAAIPYMKRKEFVMKQRLCFKCLRPFHRARDCKKTVTCNKCKGNHITSMHDPDFKPRPKG